MACSAISAIIDWRKRAKSSAFMMAFLLGASLGAAAPSHCVQRPFEIRDQIAGVLDPDRQSHEIVGNAERRAYVGGQRRMGHDGGMLDQALDAAEAFRQREQPTTLEEASCLCRPPLVR